MVQVFSTHNEIQPEAFNRKVTGNFLNMWKLKNTFLNNPWFKETVSRETTKKKKTYMELNENENKNLLPAAEIVPRGNFVVLNDGIGEGEMYQILT